MKETYKNYQILITLYMKETITFSKKKKKKLQYFAQQD